jgi:hypothetical protein
MAGSEEKCDQLRRRQSPMAEVPYPRFFLHGPFIDPTGHYVRVDSEDSCVSVDPVTGHESGNYSSIAYLVDRVREGLMTEVTCEELAERIETWNRVNVPKLRPPAQS